MILKRRLKSNSDEQTIEEKDEEILVVMRTRYDTDRWAHSSS